MHIVIDIPEDEYQRIVRHYEHFPRDLSRYERRIIDGIVLPGNHGRLIDADYLREVILTHNFHANNKYIVPYADRKGYRQRNREVDEGIINAPTILEGTK